MNLLKVSALAAVCAFAATSLSAATINFDDGGKVGQGYEESGFRFEQVTNGAVSTPNGCVDANGVNSSCLLLPNSRSGKIVKMSRIGGGTFDLLSFTFDGRDGQGPALYVSTALTGGSLFSEPDNANTMTSSGPLSQFMDVSMIFFRDADNGSSRVDDIEVSVSEVPLPASAALLLAGLGGMVAMRRRK